MIQKTSPARCTSGCVDFSLGLLQDEVKYLRCLICLFFLHLHTIAKNVSVLYHVSYMSAHLVIIYLVVI